MHFLIRLFNGSLLIALARIRKPLKTVFSLIFSNTEGNPISSIVSEVRVKNKSPVFAELFSISFAVT